MLVPLVAKHRGRFSRRLATACSSSSRSAVNAVQCAVDLQRDMAVPMRGHPGDRQVVLRIGINLGDIIVEGERSLRRRRQRRRPP